EATPEPPRRGARCHAHLGAPAGPPPERRGATRPADPGSRLPGTSTDCRSASRAAGAREREWASVVHTLRHARTLSPRSLLLRRGLLDRPVDPRLSGGDHARPWRPCAVGIAALSGSGAERRDFAPAAAGGERRDGGVRRGEDD